MVLIEKSCEMANRARIVTGPKVARCLPAHTFLGFTIQNITLFQGNLKYNTVVRDIQNITLLSGKLKM